MPQFARYIGIDYSGAEAPTSRMPALRVYQSTTTTQSREVFNPSGRKHWSREQIAKWLLAELQSGPPAFVGIDHGFSFPLPYFEKYKLQKVWALFLADFQQHWPLHDPHMYVDFIRDGLYGRGHLRCGDSKWRRIAETRCRAKSVFHFDVPGSVAKSTFTGLPWLLYLKSNLLDSVHFWPFDGWDPPPGRSVIVEAYPALISAQFPRKDRTRDQHDAYSLAEWFRQLDQSDALGQYWHPQRTPKEESIANIEGWIFGVR
jgi:hypothetical protein